HVHWTTRTPRPDPLPDDDGDEPQGQIEPVRGPHPAPQGRDQQAIDPASLRGAAPARGVEARTVTPRVRPLHGAARIPQARSSGPQSRINVRTVAGPVHLLAADQETPVLPIRLCPDLVEASGG